jgi:hypothetical protein
MKLHVANLIINFLFFILYSTVYTVIINSLFCNMPTTCILSLLNILYYSSVGRIDEKLFAKNLHLYARPQEKYALIGQFKQDLQRECFRIIRFFTQTSLFWGWTVILGFLWCIKIKKAENNQQTEKKF